ncbi:fumarate hydratase [Geobacter sulfurreducens]|jgi:fumarate hydratase class I|uniref:Fumarate hydratase class I n=1 Tax=Geobacter sulfurreducens (strain ATCC 51573 / DSM 12127 / PCA) TaxID=243231 RepID=Q74EG8_GEOSL|nr:fumarate hydratase [Geobacter sulfurreducens]AAR34321.1 fumarate hydratase, class I [Geobacter sulfurreducens PCA]ADI83835.1 fumarate hydratase, class I [Geobacter sulfurreducens KN400]AJY70726.1 fumarate hydratase [Geobacter sulfurreducens]QVW36237.1 fumarate hydratase [Geobacter sulfurreducens]UAC05047.1 fumarate hydratase [Geobacter sulfurreducens]
MSTKPFVYQDPFPLGKDETKYRKIEGSEKHVTVEQFAGKEVLRVCPEALSILANEAMRDVSFLLRPEHNESVAKILRDPEASMNDKGVALAFLRNAEISANFELPICQDTGTATVIAKKGQQVWTGGKDEEYLSKGVYKTYTEENLRYSQTVALNMYDEINTGTNLPAQVEIQAVDGDAYKFLFMAKGGGSANKTMLFQETKALLTPEKLEKFLVDKMKYLGTAACPPYHIAVVVGGCSADQCMKTVKLASAKYLDALPTQGNEHGQAFRDVELEEKLLQAAYKLGIGAQFGGKYFAHDVRVIRLPRHGASCPVGMAVSCSADRNIKAKITRDGLFVEELDRNPGRLIPEQYRGKHEHGVKIDLNRPMKEILAELSKYPVATPLLLNGTIVVGRDIAHAKFKEIIDAGKPVPEYLLNHPIYYAGPAKTPAGKPSGSFGPTTAGRMDSYVDLLQSKGASMIMIAKGNRSQQVTDACQKYGGFYLGSIGGPAAVLAEENIKKVECIDFPELGMEAVWKIEVENFPAFILVDDKGNDFFKQLGL